jgi:hypothetical protein
MLDRGAKLVAAVVGLTTLGTGVVAGILWLGRRADATEVAAHFDVMTSRFVVVERRISVSEAKAENEIEWRRWMVTQVGRMSRRMGVPVAKTPSMTPTPAVQPPTIAPPPMGPAPKDAQ